MTYIARVTVENTTNPETLAGTQDEPFKIDLVVEIGDDNGWYQSGASITFLRSYLRNDYPRVDTETEWDTPQIVMGAEDAHYGYISDELRISAFTQVLQFAREYHDKYLKP